MDEGNSMKDFEQAMERSFKPLKEGDIIDACVIGISDDVITVDLNYYTEGVIPLMECSRDPSFSIKKDINIGDTLKAMVIDSEGPNGSVILSLKEANDILAWDVLKKDLEDGTVFRVKITEAVPSGVFCFLRGIKAFIPASQLSLQYVDDTESYVGMSVDASILSADPKERRLALSAKAVEKTRALEKKSRQAESLSVNTIVDGTVEKLTPYGAFIDIGDGLTGLCHISQISLKFIKSPKEVLKIGEKVKAKIIGIEGDKISLSIKALAQDSQEGYEIPEEYSARETADESPFAKLLDGIKL